MVAEEVVEITVFVAEVGETLVEIIAVVIISVGVAAWTEEEEVPEDRVGVDQVVEAAFLIVVEESVVDAAAQRNGEEAHLVPVDPLKGHVLINLLHSLPMAMLLKHPAKAVMEVQITLTAVNNNHSNSSR